MAESLSGQTKSEFSTFTTTLSPLTKHDVVHDFIRNTTSSTSEHDNASDVMVVPSGCLVVPFSQHTPWNNPEDLVSHQTVQNFRNILDVYLLTLFFLLSAPLNIVNMIIFWRNGIKERINLCLFLLALADFIVVSGHFEWQMDRLIAAVTNTPYKPVVAKVNINNMIHSLAGFIYISGFMTTLIAFERCLCVVSPLKAQTIIQLKTTACIIAVGHVIIFAGHYVIATRWQVVCMFDPFIRQTVDTFYPSEFYFDNKDLVDTLDGTLFGILLPLFYVTGVSVSTVVTVFKLRQMKEWREKSSSADASSGTASKDITLTRMLIATNVLFVVCTTPPLVFHSLLPFFPDLSLSGKYYNTYYMLITMQQLFTYINSSVNFFFYYFFGTKFRRSVQQIFCTWCRYTGSKLPGKNVPQFLS